MNSDSAKSGFKTFILTLSISLIVFSVIYYLVTNGSEDSNTSAYQASLAPAAVSEEPKEVLGTEADNAPAIESEEVSIFGELAAADVKSPSTGSAAVLAGATSSPTPQTTSSVPETGLVGITAGLLVSLVFFLTGMYYISSNPRKSALTGFEKKVLKDN